MTNELSSPVFFSRALYQSIVDHARSVHPEECCGLVASDQTGHPARVIPMTNILHSPVRYQMDPREQFSVGKAIRLEGMAIWGIYHSHPLSEPYPSVVDVNLAYYPDVFYLLTSQVTTPPALRIFQIQNGKVMEFPLILNEGG